MKFKLENDQIVLKDGLPMVILDSGDERPFDVLAKITELNQESAERRHANKSLQTEKESLQAKLDAFAEIGSVTEIKTKLAEAERALEKVPQAKELSSKIAQQEAQIEALTGTVNERDSALTQAKDSIFSLTVGQAFATSKFLTEKTLFDPETAMNNFQRHFTVQEMNGKHTVVGYLDPSNRDKPIFSRDPSRNGAIASFDEAMQLIWDAYPHKDRYSKEGQDRGGSGGKGNRGEAPPSGVKVGVMTAAQKADYIEKYGLEAFSKLFQDIQTK